MSFFDILKSIDNGSLHTTEGIYPVPEPEIQDRKFSAYRIKQFEYYCSIISCLEQNLITGDKFISNESDQYKNLKLTKLGEETLKFGSLTLKDIDNSYGKDSLKVWLLRPIIVVIFTSTISGVIGFYVGKQLQPHKPCLEQDQSNIKLKQ